MYILVSRVTQTLNETFYLFNSLTHFTILSTHLSHESSPFNKKIFFSIGVGLSHPPVPISLAHFEGLTRLGDTILDFLTCPQADYLVSPSFEKIHSYKGSTEDVQSDSTSTPNSRNLRNTFVRLFSHPEYCSNLLYLTVY